MYISFLLSSQAWGTHGTEKCMSSFGKKPDRKRPLSRPRGRRDDNTVLKFILETG
jgi:hypothetical protein